MQTLFTNNIEANGITCRHIRGEGLRSGKEFHLYHEIIYFLGGEAEFISEDLHMRPQPETLIVVPKETYHQMLIHADPNHYHRCLVQFDIRDTALSKVIAISADQEIRYLMGKLISLCDSGANSNPSLVQAALTLLLDALKDKRQITAREDYQIDLIRHATDYINQNIHTKLLIDQIAAYCNVSSSTLCHVFKKEMNIPIHKFIVKKRLINAHHKIAAGGSATAAAQECGFSDYSGFYKQYKQAFGYPPSKKTEVR